MKRTPEELYQMRKDYAKQRLKQLKDPDLLKNRPYWKYVSDKLISHCHAEWDGLVLHYADPWWKKNFPPNGKECHCRVTAVRPEHYTGQIAPLN